MMMCDKYRVPQIRSPFCNLSLSTKRRGVSYMGCNISLAIMPSLLVPHPQLCVQIEEDNAFDNFAVAIWKDVIVGHVLRELARTCWYFLKKRQQYDLQNHWTQKIVISRRQSLGCSCVYIFKACRQTHSYRIAGNFCEHKFSRITG